MEFTDKYMNQFGYMSIKDTNAILNTLWLIISIGALTIEDLKNNTAALNLYVWYREALSNKIDSNEPSVKNYEEWKSKYAPIITSFLLVEYEIVCSILLAIALMNSDSEGRSMQLEIIANLDSMYEKKNGIKLDISKVTKIIIIMVEENLDFVGDYRFKSLDELKEIINKW